MFDRKRDAKNFEAELRRRSQVGTLSTVDSSRMTLAEYVSGTWARAYASNLAPATRKRYGHIYDKHILPELGPLSLREITPESVARWQAERLAIGGGPVAVREALRSCSARSSKEPSRHSTSRRIRSGLFAVLRCPTRPRCDRWHRLSSRRCAPPPARGTRLCSVSSLTPAAARPEALALRWGDVRHKTLLVERAISLGVEKDTKTAAHRTVRLLTPLAADLREWRMHSGRPPDAAFIFPSTKGTPWTDAAYRSWRRRAFRRALTAAGVERARPYDLRHSFASLLLHEGSSVIKVARQLGHDARG